MVLLSFAWANMKLKFNRPRLPRGAVVGWSGVIFGFIGMSVGLIGNIAYNQSILFYFLIYLALYFSLIVGTFQRVPILKLLIYVCNQADFLEKKVKPLLVDAVIASRSHTVVFFAKTSEIAILNKAIK